MPAEDLSVIMSNGLHKYDKQNQVSIGTIHIQLLGVSLSQAKCII